MYWLAHQILCAFRASKSNKKEKESKSVKSHSSKKWVPLVQRTIWQPAFKRQTHKVFMCVPAVQWVQTATEEFIKRGERIVKLIKFKPRPNKKWLSLQHCRKESKPSLVMTLQIQKNNMFLRQKNNRFWFHHYCSGLFWGEKNAKHWRTATTERRNDWEVIRGELAQMPMRLTYFQYSSMEQSWLKEGFIFTWVDLCSHQFRVSGQYSSTLLVEVYPSHGGDIINVIVIPASN